MFSSFFVAPILLALREYLSMPVARVLSKLCQHPAPVASLHHLDELFLPVPGSDPVHGLGGHDVLNFFPCQKTEKRLFSDALFSFTSLLSDLYKVSPASITCLEDLKGFVPTLKSAEVANIVKLL